MILNVVIKFHSWWIHDLCVMTQTKHVADYSPCGNCGRLFDGVVQACTCKLKGNFEALSA